MTVPAASLRSRRACLLGLVALLAFDVVVGVRGIPFGEHWDEWYAKKGVKRVVRDLELFPGDFTYNGVYFDLAAAPVLVRAVPHVPKILQQIKAKPTRPLDAGKYPAIRKMQKELEPWVGRTGYVHSARALFLALSLLAVVAVYAILRSIVRDRPEAALAGAAFLGLSWEFGYHARYIAVDALMAMLAGVMLLGIARARATSDAGWAQLWLAVAAAAGGLALGCKVTGITFCVPIAVGALLTPALPTTTARLRRLSFVALVFTTTFLLSTPGVARDFIRFMTGVFHTSFTYASHPKFGYVVDGPFDMAWKLGFWLFAAVPSAWWLPGLACSAVAVVGLVRLHGVERPFFWVCASFALVHGGLVFTAGQLQARNALPLATLLAIGFGLGVCAVLDAMRGRSSALGLALAFVGLLVVHAASQAAFLVQAAESVRSTTKDSIRAEATAWLLDNADRPVRVAPRLYADIGAALAVRYDCKPPTVHATPAVIDIDAKTPPPALLDPAVPRFQLSPIEEEEGRVALYFNEHVTRRWHAHRPWFYERHFTSQETNLVPYPNWRGRHWHDRIVALSTKSARENDTRLEGYAACVPQ